MGDVTNLEYVQPFETSVKVGAEVDSKGNVKPNAEVKITRKLVSGDQVYECVFMDLDNGIENVKMAIKRVLGNGN